MKRRNGVYSDINWRKLKIIQNVTIFFAGLLAILAILMSIDQRATIATEQKHAKFNQLPYDQRIAIANWEGLTVDDDYLQPVLSAEQLSRPKGLRNLLYGMALLVLLLGIIIIFSSYNRQRDRTYFLADLPSNRHGKPYTLYLTLPISWPFLLRSYLRMRRWEKNQISLASNSQNVNTNREAEETSENDNASHTADCSDSNNLEQCYTYEQPLADQVNFSKNSYEQYLEYFRTLARCRHQQKLLQVEQKIARLEDDLRDYGERIQARQLDLHNTKVIYRDLKKQSEPLSQYYEENQLLADWQAIKGMRGVTNICLEDKALCIDVAVRVPYQGQLYDFGDFQIVIVGPDAWKCYLVRPGFCYGLIDDTPCQRCEDECNKANCINYINENAENTFCFGDRATGIQEYLNAGQFRAAIILMIDSLHSVNHPEDLQAIPYCYRRVIYTQKEGE